MTGVQHQREECRTKVPSGGDPRCPTQGQRIDVGWFTLCHELAHISRHLDGGDVTAFIDDLDVTSKDKREHEADILASNSLVPRDEWDTLKRTRWTASIIQTTASRLRVDPAIVAGRIRREKCNYKIFTGLLGNQKVRKMFGIGLG